MIRIFVRVIDMIPIEVISITLQEPAFVYEIYEKIPLKRTLEDIYLNGEKTNERKLLKDGDFVTFIQKGE